MPGQWILQAGAKIFGWQEQKGWFLTGASLRPTGDPLVSFSFLVKFWDVRDWNSFQQFRTKYLTRPVFTGASVNYAIGIIHPELNFHGVTQVVPAETPFFTNNGKGLWTGTVKFLQYRKPVAALESPAAAIPGAAPPTPSANDARNAAKALRASQIARRGG
jgi:hypothetical protein